MDIKEAFVKQKSELNSAKIKIRTLEKKLERFTKEFASTVIFQKQLSEIQGLNMKISELSGVSNRYQSLYEQEKEKYRILYEKYIHLEFENQHLTRQLHGNDCEKTVPAADLEEANRKLRVLSDEVARLTAIINHDSTNTGTPTSKTPLNRKKVIPDSRVKSDKFIGGQPGHEKHSMTAFSEAEITEKISHTLDCCPACGGILTETKEIAKDELDYEVKVVKKRHMFKEYVCSGCGKTFRTKHASLKAENQYGPVIQAMALSLLNLGFVSISRTKKLLSAVNPSAPLSEGYISKLQKRYSEQLQEFVNDVRFACICSPLIYWDDTVIFVNTARACMRFYGTERIALYTSHPQKIYDGLMADGILPDLPYTATVMHDHNTMNYHPGFFFRNVECLQHLERDLQKIYDCSGHIWANSMKELIRDTIHKRKQLIGQNLQSFSDDEISSFFEKYDSLLTSGSAECLADFSSYFGKEERALIRRLEKFRKNYTLWISDFSIPTTNNLSERSLRFVKSKVKISGHFQNIEHARYFANLRTYIETCARNGVNEFQALLRLTSGNPIKLDEIYKPDDV